MKDYQYNEDWAGNSRVQMYLKFAGRAEGLVALTSRSRDGLYYADTCF